MTVRCCLSKAASHLPVTELLGPMPCTSARPVVALHHPNAGCAPWTSQAPGASSTRLSALHCRQRQKRPHQDASDGPCETASHTPGHSLPLAVTPEEVALDEQQITDSGAGRHEPPSVRRFKELYEPLGLCSKERAQQYKKVCLINDCGKVPGYDDEPNVEWLECEDR